jgi:hypothetical protein
MSSRERVESPLRPGAPADAVLEREPGRGRLHLRELSGWEEEYVERHQDDINTARLCNEVLARCVVEPRTSSDQARQRVRDLLVPERDRELVALRAASLGPSVAAQVPCPACGEFCEVDFSLDGLPLDFASPPREITAEVDGVGRVELRLPTAGDQEELLDLELDGEAERRTVLLARCLARYGDRTGGFDAEFARALPVRARSQLERALEAALPDFALEMAVECPNCGSAFKAPFDVASFFLSS